MAFPVAAVVAGISLASKIFGGKPKSSLELYEQTVAEYNKFKSIGAKKIPLMGSTTGNQMVMAYDEKIDNYVRLLKVNPSLVQPDGKNDGYILMAVAKIGETQQAAQAAENVATQQTVQQAATVIKSWSPFLLWFFGIGLATWLIFKIYK